MSTTQYPLTRFQPTEQHLISVAILALSCFAVTFLTYGNSSAAILTVGGILVSITVRFIIQATTQITDRATNRLALGGAIISTTTGALITVTGSIVPVLVASVIFTGLSLIQLYLYL